uniref:Uncharacterized protein n=1 Tax=Arundo donax TaxID=35708 RepID=A0A0A8Z370_ARUDO
MVARLMLCRATGARKLCVRGPAQQSRATSARLLLCRATAARKPRARGPAQ